MDQFTKAWVAAKSAAKAKGLQIVEHGWEQHVIIDAPNNQVYRYPRHPSALAKLEDEVSILAHLNQFEWSVRIPKLADFDGHRARYSYIAGDVLDEARISSLSASQLQTIGEELGTFLAQLHSIDPALVHHKAWRQKGTLLEYYQKRIREAPDDSQWKPAATDALNSLEGLHRSTHPKEVVVHGDLHGLNTVITTDGNHLAGVIDLSEIEFGDPHQDFRKIFMTDTRLLTPSISGYESHGGASLNEELIKLWAYVNEWSNLCFFENDPHNATYQRATAHLERWNQI